VGTEYFLASKVATIDSSEFPRLATNRSYHTLQLDLDLTLQKIVLTSRWAFGYVLTYELIVQEKK